MPDNKEGSGRGFASMDENKQREIASQGGKASGGNFANDPERAADAGRRGGQQSSEDNSRGQQGSQRGREGGQQPSKDNSRDEQGSQRGHQGARQGSEQQRGETGEERQQGSENDDR